MLENINHFSKELAPREYPDQGFIDAIVSFPQDRIKEDTLLSLNALAAYFSGKNSLQISTNSFSYGTLVTRKAIFFSDQLQHEQKDELLAEYIRKHTLAAVPFVCKTFVSKRETHTPMMDIAGSIYGKLHVFHLVFLKDIPRDSTQLRNLLGKDAKHLVSYEPLNARFTIGIKNGFFKRVKKQQYTYKGEILVNQDNVKCHYAVYLYVEKEDQSKPKKKKKQQTPISVLDKLPEFQYI